MSLFHTTIDNDLWVAESAYMLEVVMVDLCKMAEKIEQVYSMCSLSSCPVYHKREKEGCSARVQLCNSPLHVIPWMTKERAQPLTSWQLRLLGRAFARLAELSTVYDTTEVASLEDWYYVFG